MHLLGCAPIAPNRYASDDTIEVVTGGTMKAREERRLIENEMIFKEVNKDIDGFLHDVGVQKVLRAPFYCECSDIHCTRRIDLSAAEYEGIHRNPKRFIVLNGHEDTKIERVVERRDTYEVVEKLPDLPSAREVAHRLKELGT